MHRLHAGIDCSSIICVQVFLNRWTSVKLLISFLSCWHLIFCYIFCCPGFVFTWHNASSSCSCCCFVDRNMISIEGTFPFHPKPPTFIMLNVNTDVPMMERIYSVLSGLRYHENRLDVLCVIREVFYPQTVWKMVSVQSFNHDFFFFWHDFTACEINKLRMKEASKIQYLAVFFPNDVCLCVQSKQRCFWRTDKQLTSSIQLFKII